MTAQHFLHQPISRRRPTCHWHCCNRRGAALYIAVMSTALIVGLLGLSTLTLVQIERTSASTGSEQLIATRNSQSAVELALQLTATDTNWRSIQTNGIETTPQLIGSSDQGTVSWIFSDSDGSLTDADTLLRVTGIGRLGSAVQANSVQLEVPIVELRSQIGTGSHSFDSVIADKWWCQYLKVSLPANATGWKITSLEIYCYWEFPNETLQVRIYDPLPSNMPSTTVIDAVDIAGNQFTSAAAWQEIDLSGNYVLDPNDGVCIALQGTHEWKSPIQLAYENGGVSEPESAMITGDPTWNSYETSKALMYKIHGVYWTPDGVLRPISGSSRREVAPSP